MRLWNLIRVALAATFILALAAPVEAGLLKRLRDRRASQSCGASAASQSCGVSAAQAIGGCR